MPLDAGIQLATIASLQKLRDELQLRKQGLANFLSQEESPASQSIESLAVSWRYLCAEIFATLYGSAGPCICYVEADAVSHIR